MTNDKQANNNNNNNNNNTNNSTSSANNRGGWGFPFGYHLPCFTETPDKHVCEKTDQYGKFHVNTDATQFDD